MGGGNQELQQLSQQLQQLEAEKEELEGEVEELRDEKSEMDEAIEAIETLDTGSVVQVPLGGGAYIRASVEDIDEVVVELGGGYAAERDQNGAIESLKSRKDVVDQHISDTQEEIAEIDAESDQLEQKAQQMQQQQMQQQMQQMQQQEDEDE
ncbi:prefoldin subunit alpha [Haladaptatus sp. DFWS20]|uniref:prefoldin subunit alpha n=1 Tax=Haladaptatus sp. DFWS20 TaxID=3403467 RepID=UPI003EB6CAC6